MRSVSGGRSTPIATRAGASFIGHHEVYKGVPGERLAKHVSGARPEIKIVFTFWALVYLTGKRR